MITRKFSKRIFIFLLLLTLIGNTTVLAAETKDITDKIPEYDYVESFSEGLAAARKNNRWGFINELGEVVIPFSYSEVSRFSEGLAVVRIDRRFGYINQNGDIVIEAQFESAEPFSEGRAIVKVDGKFGAIDREGNTVVAAEYDEMQPYTEGFAVVSKGGYYNYVNRNGVPLLKSSRLVEAYPFTSGIAKVCERLGYWYYINKSGHFAFRTDADWVDSFIDGYAIAIKDNRSFLLNTQGTRVTGTYEIIENAEADGYFLIYSNGRYGYYDIDKKRSVISYSFQRILPPSEGLSVAVKDGLYGFVDSDLNTKIPFKYSYAESFSEGLSIVSKNGKYGFINKEGVEVIPCIYEEAESFHEGLAVVRRKGSFGCIDKSGEFIFLDEFGYIQGFENGVSIAKRSGRYVVLRNPLLNKGIAEALPSTAFIKIDEKPIEIEAYTIAGHNYIRISDLAYVLEGSGKKFASTFMADENRVILHKNKVYMHTGNELSISGYTKPRRALAEKWVIEIAGRETHVISYNVANSRFFKLRDLAQLIDFSVEWNADKREILIVTTKSYIEDHGS